MMLSLYDVLILSEVCLSLTY